MYFLLVLIFYHVEPAENENLIIYGNRQNACEKQPLAASSNPALQT